MLEAELLALAVAAVLVIAGWTLWSVNRGRLMSRWWRRQLRRIAVLVLALLALFLFLTEQV